MGICTPQAREEAAKWHDACAMNLKHQLARTGDATAQANVRSYLDFHTTEAQRLRTTTPQESTTP